MNTFSDRLKHARKTLGYTQQALARVSGVSQSAIASYESGNRHTSRSLRALANALRVSLDWLDTGKGEMAIADTYASATSSLKESDYATNYPQISAWPFKTFTMAQYLVLSAQQRQLAEDLILTLIQANADHPRSKSK